MGRILAVVAATALLMPHPGRALEQMPSSAAPEIRRILGEVPWTSSLPQHVALREFYAGRAHEPGWFAGGRVIAQARAVVARIESIDTRGLDPRRYGAGTWGSTIQALERAPAPGAIASFDVALSAAVLAVASDLHFGRANPGAFASMASAEPDTLRLPAFLEALLGSCDVAGDFEAIEPRYDAYRRLLRARERYARMAMEGEHPTVTEASSVKPGEAWQTPGPVPAILRQCGDLAPDANVTDRYEGAVVEAVRRFQRRHGLDDDGIIGPQTIAALNVPWSRRVRQVDLTLERWRWVPVGFRRRPIVVNVPEFRLRAFDASGQVLAMNVVVGQAYRTETPMFGAELQSIVFRPYWNVPPSIQRKEIVPRLSRDPGWLGRNGYEIVRSYDDRRALAVTAGSIAGLRNGSLLVRQRPGRENSLGLVKFSFPNTNNVYMHDTPATHLFSESRRDFSHGCIRLHRPVELAEFVLRDQPAWTREAIRAAMESGPTRHVRLSAPIPVLIVYSTVIVSRDGTVQFFEDVYGHDAELEASLGERHRVAGGDSERHQPRAVDPAQKERE